MRVVLWMLKTQGHSHHHDHADTIVVDAAKTIVVQIPVVYEVPFVHRPCQIAQRGDDHPDKDTNGPCITDHGQRDDQHDDNFELVYPGVLRYARLHRKHMPTDEARRQVNKQTEYR